MYSWAASVSLQKLLRDSEKRGVQFVTQSTDLLLGNEAWQCHRTAALHEARTRSTTSCKARTNEDKSDLTFFILAGGPLKRVRAVTIPTHLRTTLARSRHSVPKYFSSLKVMHDHHLLSLGQSSDSYSSTCYHRKLFFHEGPGVTSPLPPYYGSASAKSHKQRGKLRSCHTHRHLPQYLHDDILTIFRQHMHPPSSF